MKSASLPRSELDRSRTGRLVLFRSSLCAEEGQSPTQSFSHFPARMTESDKPNSVAVDGFRSAGGFLHVCKRKGSVQPPSNTRFVWKITGQAASLRMPPAHPPVFGKFNNHTHVNNPFSSVLRSLEAKGVQIGKLPKRIWQGA